MRTAYNSNLNVLSTNVYSTKIKEESKRAFYLVYEKWVELCESSTLPSFLSGIRLIGQPYWA